MSNEERPKNVLFVTSAAPDKSPFSTVEKSPPLGLGSLIAIARAAGHNVHFIDNYLRPSRFIEEGFLENNALDFVGIYSNTICYRDTLRMLEAIETRRKQGQWKGRIAVGGPHASVYTPQAAIPAYVDHVAAGPGESVILDLIEGRMRDREIQGPSVENLDALPFQPWDLFTQLDYDFTCLWLDTRPVFTLNTSRGCPMRCAFCSVGSIWGNRYDTFSPQRIVAEIRHLVTRYGAKGIYFREDNFTLDKQRVRAFCEQLDAEAFRIEWACESTAPSLCDEGLVRAMAASGCRAVYLGVESGSPRMLERINKKITVSQIERCAALCRRHGIRTYFSLIAGLPGETFADFLRTVRMVWRCKPDHYAFNVFVGIPGSPLYEKIRAEDLYEYEDGVGLLYLPGYHVKTRVFYDRDSRELVDHTFRQVTGYDRLLRSVLAYRKIKRLIKRMGGRAS